MPKGNKSTVGSSSNPHKEMGTSVKVTAWVNMEFSINVILAFNFSLFLIDWQK